MSKVAKNRVKSTWTPLSNEETNHKIFEERRDLVNKWFEKWTDAQRRKVLGDLLAQCKVKQIEFAGNIVNQKRPIYRDDFTRILPRVLSLYVFSFLDPRSLCRCSQVCWSWKYMTELDQLWMPKCVRLGWVLPFTPSPYETGTWKRQYIESIMQLQCLRPASTPVPLESDLKKLRLEFEDGVTPRRPLSSKRPPWKGSDPNPKDTWRNNYLENDDEIEKVNKLRKKGMYGTETQTITQKASTKLNTGKHQANTPKKTMKTKLFNGSIYTGERPEWAKASAGAPFVHGMLANTTTPQPPPETPSRPAPVQQMKLVKTTIKRTPRDPPSQDLFPERPWKVPNDVQYDSDT